MRAKMRLSAIALFWDICKNPLLIALTLASLVCFAFALVQSEPVRAAQTVPYKINFQGRLTNSAGNIMPDGSYNMRLRLWTTANGGTDDCSGAKINCVWSETRDASTARVVVTNGLFSVQLGDHSALSASIFASYPLYLEVELPTTGTATCSGVGCAVWTEGAMTPRHILGSAATAMNADTIDGIDGANLGQLNQNNTWSGTNAIQNTSATAFRVQSSAGANTFLAVDTNGNQITIGNSTADATGVLLRLDDKNTTGDPTGVAGAMYYNSFSGKFRCYQVSTWTDCIGTGGSGGDVYLANANTFTNTNTINATSTTAFRIQTTSGATNLLTADTTNMSITINGSIDQTGTKLTLKGSVAAGTATNFPRDMVVVGNYAYLINQVGATGSMTIIDVSDPTSPVVEGTVSHADLGGAREIRVKGRYAYVVSFTNATFTVIDVANPTAPAIVGTLADTTNLASVHGLEIQGNYAFAAVSNPGRLTVIDITRPASPALVTSVSDSVNLSQTRQIEISGRYAYMTNYGNDGLTVFDINNPASPVLAGTVTSATQLDGARDVEINGRYAYVASDLSDSLTIVDISNPASPSIAGFVTNTAMDEAMNVTLNGRYAYVSGRTSHTVAVVDISNPASPSIVANAGYNAAALTPLGTEMHGRYMYVATNVNTTTSSTFTVLDTGGASLNATTVNTLDTHDLHVEQSADIANKLNVGDSLTVGQGGIKTDGLFAARGGIDIQPTVLDGESFTVHNVAGAKLFTINTSTNIIQIGSATADTTGVQLVLDHKSDAADPTGPINGGMYYNANSNKFRCYENSVWKDCISPISIVTLGSDVINNNATANTMANVTGLSFSVTAGTTYRFKANIIYTAAATTTGSRWSVSGPASPTLIAYKSNYSLTTTTDTINTLVNAYDTPATSSASSAVTTTGNIAQIEGTITPSANGTFAIRFASEVASSAITAKAGSTLMYW